MNGGSFLRPRRLDEALAARASPEWQVLAGGTDLYAARAGSELPGRTLDVSRIEELRGIGMHRGEVRIGAAVTWSELLAAPLPPVFNGLKSAAREIGGMQIQNAGTVGGNLCNASPAADGVPALLALEAEVEIASLRGVRRVGLADFVLGSRRTALARDELLVAIRVPDWPDRSRATFLKLGHRRYLVISVAMVAATIAVDADGRVARCAIAVGACSAVARRLRALEDRLTGTASDRVAGLVEPGDLDVLTPIDDLRGSAAYRKDAVFTLLTRALRQAAAA